MDVLHDQSYRQWLAIEAAYDVPDYVNTSEAMSKEAAAELNDNLFADIVHRQFPVDTPASTWLSAAYFNENKEQIKAADLREFIHDTIVKAAGIHEISKDIDEVFATRIAEVIDPVEDDDNYCLVIKDASGKTVSRRYPVFDEVGLKKACEYFVNNRSKYPIDVRSKVAVSLSKKAKEYGSDLPALIYKEAAEAVPYRPVLMDELLERAKLTKDAEAGAVIGTLVEMVNFATSEDLIKSAEEVVTLIDDLDHLNGLNKYYGTKILSPHEVVYSMPIKEASAMADDALKLDKLTFSITKLAELGNEVFENVLGEDFVNEIVNEQGKLDVSKMAAIIPTLPRPEKVVLEEHIVRRCNR